MPLYATLADLQARYEDADLLQLTDQNDTGAIVQSTIDSAIADASAVIDGYVARRHSNLELVKDSPVLKRLCCQIAFYELWRDDVPENIRKTYEDAISSLKQIANGNFMLDVGEEVAPPRKDAIHANSSPRKTSRKSLEGF